jgi:hypothetical protein
VNAKGLGSLSALLLLAISEYDLPGGDPSSGLRLPNRRLMPEFGGLSGAQPIRRWLRWRRGGVAQYERPFDVVDDIGQADLGRCDKRRAGFSQRASVRKDIVRWMTLPSDA